jgi:hypothetical protein
MKKKWIIAIIMLAIYWYELQAKDLFARTVQAIGNQNNPKYRRNRSWKILPPSRRNQLLYKVFSAGFASASGCMRDYLVKMKP